MKQIDLTISDNYVSDWGLWEAIRELAQNALDHAEDTETKIAIGYYKKTSTFILASQNTKLSTKSLILGSSSKTDDTTQRGQFGEGYKLALVVLLRLGLSVTIYNADELWKPKFSYSKEFDCNLLSIKITPRASNNKNVTFAIKGIDRAMSLLLKNRLIIDRVKSIGYKTKYGTILTEERFKGQVFVGGLFVCEPNLQLEQGFDFDPMHVTLGRDRGLIDSFNVQWLAAQMWTTIEKEDYSALTETVNLIYAGSNSTHYIGTSGNSEAITKAVGEKFYLDFPKTAIPVISEAETKRVVKDFDNAIPVVVSETVQRVVKNSSSYAEHKQLLKERVYLTPQETITQILAKYKKSLGSLHSVLSDELIPFALKWENKDAR